jgi:hypothetical protein
MLLFSLLIQLHLFSAPTLTIDQLAKPTRVFSTAVVDQKVMLNLIGTEVGDIRHFLFDMQTKRGSYMDYHEQGIWLTHLHSSANQFVIFHYDYKKRPRLFLADTDGANLTPVDISHIEAWQGKMHFLFAFPLGDKTFLINWQDDANKETTHQGVFDPFAKTLTDIGSVEGSPDLEPIIVPFQKDALKIDLLISEIQLLRQGQQPKTLLEAKPNVLFRVRNFDKKNLWYRTMYHMHLRGDLLQIEHSDHFDDSKKRKSEPEFKVIQLGSDLKPVEVSYLLLASYQGEHLIWDYPDGHIRLVKDLP